MKSVNTFSISKTAEELVPDTIGRTGYMAAIVITFLVIILLVLVWSKLPSVVPLFFTQPWGEARLASRDWLFLLPGLSLLSLVGNVILGKIGGNLSPLLPRMLGMTSGVVSLAMLLSLIGIVQSLTL